MKAGTRVEEVAIREASFVVLGEQRIKTEAIGIGLVDGSSLACGWLIGTVRRSGGKERRLQVEDNAGNEADRGYL